MPKVTQAPVTDPEINLSPSGIQPHIFRETAKPLGKEITHERSCEKRHMVWWKEDVKGKWRNQEGENGIISLTITYIVLGMFQAVLGILSILTR